MSSNEILVQKQDWKEHLESFNKNMEEFSGQYRQAYYTGFERPEATDWLRISALGKPLIVQAMGHPAAKAHLSSIQYEEQPHSEKLQLIFTLGHFLEMWALGYLERQGYVVESQQKEVELYSVVGHIDAVIYKPGQPKRVVDIKSMNDRRFQQLVRYGVDDRMGYLTQLSCYSECVGARPAMLAINKNTAEVHLVDCNDADVAEVKSIIESRIKRLRSVETWEDICALPRPPMVPEVYKKQETGRYRLHETVQYWQHRDIFWDIYTEVNGYGKLTEYTRGEL